jgi:hypothetical protein
MASTAHLAPSAAPGSARWALAPSAWQMARHAQLTPNAAATFAIMVNVSLSVMVSKRVLVLHVSDGQRSTSACERFSSMMLRKRQEGCVCFGSSGGVRRGDPVVAGDKTSVLSYVGASLVFLAPDV